MWRATVSPPSTGAPGPVMSRISYNEAITGSISRFFRSRAMVRHIVSTSDSAVKYSLRSPRLCTREITPQSCSARSDIEAFPREMCRRSITSSVHRSRPVMYSRAWTSAIVRLMPHALPICPHAAMNRSWAWTTSGSTLDGSGGVVIRGRA